MRIRVGERPAFTVSWASSASTSGRAASANTWCAAASRRPRLGGRFWRITRRSWFRSTSSECQRFTSKFFTCFSCWPTTVAALLHFHVTAHPTAEWTGQQLGDAFAFAQLPRYLLRDRDAIFSHEFQDQVCETWACAKFCRRHARPGSEPISSE